MTDIELIGRDAELSQACRFLEETSAGPASLLIEGEPGIGKSALWLRVLEGVSGGPRILMSRPSAAEAGLPFAVLNDLLEPLLPAALDGLSEPRRMALEVALLRRPVRAAPPEPRAVALAALDLLRAASANRPVVLAIDDEPSIDASSRRTLRFVARRLKTEPIHLLLTARVDGADDVFGALDPRSIQRIRLGPLSVAALHRIVSVRLDAHVPRHLLVRLHAQSGGNPFYALEIARSLIRQGIDDIGPHDALPVPETLHGVVAERLATLSPMARRAALYAAALSQPTASVLARLEDGRALVDALDEAVAVGILEFQGERVTFAHPLLASILYSETPASDRRRAHAALAIVADPLERGRHIALASVVPDASAAAALEVAARAAVARAAPDAAAALFEESRRLTPPDAGKERYRRGLEAVDHRLRAGDLSAAETLATRMLASADPGVERASILLRLASIKGREDSWAECEAWLSKAVVEATDSPSLSSQAHRELAFVLMVRGDLARSASHAQLALEWAQRSGDTWQEASAAIRLAVHRFMQGEGIRHDLLAYGESLQAGPPHGPSDEMPMFDFDIGHAIMLKWADDFDDARSRLQERHALARGLGNDAPLPFILYHLAELEVWAGDLAAAESYAREAERLAELSEQVSMLGAVGYSSALVDAYRGRIDAARGRAEDTLSTASRTGNVPIAALTHGLLGFIALSVGDMAATSAHLDPLAGAMAAIGAGEPGLVRFHADEIEALVALGRLSEAEALVEWLEERGSSLDRAWALVVATRGRALLHAARGHPEAALESLEHAMELHPRLPMPFELARTLLLRGAIERRLKHKSSSKASLEAALEVFDRLGTPLWAEKARSELRRVGIRPPAPLELTPTEERVAELVAAGHTNREVADALFMSARTVESNLSKIYRKLGVRSRTELANRTGSTGDAPPGP